MRYQYTQGKDVKIVEVVQESDKFLTLREILADGSAHEFKKKKPVPLVEIPDYDGERPTFDYWITTPYQHQIDSLKYAEENNCFLNRDKPGLGKTKQSLDLIMNRKRCGQIKRALVVCCVGGLQYNWLREVKKHTDLKGYILGTRFIRKNSTTTHIAGNNAKLEDLKVSRADILICNIEMLRHDEIHTQLQLMIARGELGMIVVDEIHKAKNPKAKQTANLFKLHPKYKLGLTGTPVINSPLDIHPIACWMGKELRSLSKFKEEYCELADSYFSKTKEVVGYKNLDKLAWELDQWSLMRTKEQCLDLPPKVIKTVYTELTQKQKEVYREVQKDIRDRKEEILASPTPMGRFVALRKATGCPSAVTDGFTFDDCAKAVELMRIVEQAIENGEKIIIFAWHVETIHYLNGLMHANKIVPAVIYGDVSNEAREANKRAFQEIPECKVIIGNYQTMGTGFDLFAASWVVEYEQPWTAADEDQAQDRAHRIGVQKTVNCIRLLTLNTVDEHICTIVDSKRDLSQTVESKQSVAAFIDKVLSDQV